MRIIFLSHYFPPEVNAPASRTYEHCKQWAADGHEVTVLTCAPNHPRGTVYVGYRNRLFQREERDGIKIVRLWTYVTANEGILKRTLNYVSFMVATILAAPLLPKTDVVISTSPQFFNGLAGYFVSRLKRRPWVLEVRDLWPESILAVGAIKNKTVIRMLEHLEMFAYRKADRIVPVTDAFKDYMVRKGIDPEKITVIKNGVDLSFYQVPSGENPLRAKLGLGNKFLASYVGTHGMAHHLETVLEAGELLKHRSDIALLMVGDGAERARLFRLLVQRELPNVQMLEQLPKDQMPNLWDLSSVSMVLLRKSELFKTVIPSKIFESMGMRKPIILGVEGESAEIINHAGAGFCIEPENSEQLAARIIELADDPALVDRMGKAGQQYVAAHFDRKALARQFEGLLDRLVAR